MAKADILNILYSRDKSPLEFKFDSLTAPPLLSFITVNDIERLYNIASSVKYSSKIELKYKEINNIMRNRGFIKFASGTNRVVYRPLESNLIITKIAIDKVGLRDTPDEYRNQFLLKPFVTKVFESSPCGTIGSFERVQPIISRQEFQSVADNIFELLNNHIIGEYVLEDIGTKYFMNYGLRTGFGPVLLDFPYVFKLDGNKLYCTTPIISNGGTPCGGVIDYDNGFNNLICSSCGRRYLATELKDEKSNIKLITKGDDFDMKIQLCKGRNVIRESENATDTIKIRKQKQTPRSFRNENILKHSENILGTVILANRSFKNNKGVFNKNESRRVYSKKNDKKETDNIKNKEMIEKYVSKYKKEYNTSDVDIQKNEKYIEPETYNDIEIKDDNIEEKTIDSNIKNHNDTDEILDKYDYLEDEFDDTNFSKIPKNPKQFY